MARPKTTSVIKKIKKRDGRVVAFEVVKIERAIWLAAKAAGGENRKRARYLAGLVVKELEKRFNKTIIPEVEQVQDIAEKILIQKGHDRTYKAFTLYRDLHEKMRDISSLVDSDELIQKYLDKASWLIKENANMTYSLQGLNNHVASIISANFWLNKIYPRSVRKAHKFGDVHIHDLALVSAYCTGWDLKDILIRGFGGVSGKLNSKPPKHFGTALGQLVNFFYTLQGEIAGAVAISNFDSYLAPFIAQDKLTYKEVKQDMQEFLFNINVPTRVGFQCVSQDTEILTKDGWRNYKEVTKGSIIKTFNLETKKIEDQKVTSVFSNSYQGDMYNLKNRIQDQLISPKHRVVRKEFQTERYVLGTIEEVIKLKSQLIIPTISENYKNIQGTEITTIKRLKYKGIIWCPHTKNETIIARRNGKAFITGNTPFTNVTLDLIPPKIVGEEAVIIGGKPIKAKYKEFQKEINLFNKAFAEVMVEGDAQGRVFTFPIPTYSITKEFDWNNPVLEPVFEMTRKYGVPYWANYINSDMKPEDTRSMCCRLQLDNRVLRKRGGLFAANPLTGCYDEDTEILTEDGWVFFSKLEKKHRVFTLTKDNEFELHNPTKLFKYEWKGELYRFKAKSLDLLVTPNHRMVIDTMYKVRKFIEAQDFDVNNHRIPKKGIWVGKEEEWFILPSITFIKYGAQGKTSYKVIRDSLKIKMDDWLAFFGIWIAEGCTDNEKIAKSHGYRIFITQSNKKKRKEIENLLAKLPFNYYKDKYSFIICNKQLWTYLRQFGICYTKSIPKEYKALSKRQLKILFDWLVKGDGHIRKTTGQINYWTVSKKLADDIQEIIIKLGFSSTIIIQKGKAHIFQKREIKGGDIYCIGVLRSRHHRLRKSNISKEFYKGKVYCCQVVNNTVLVRRNGKVCWSGNSIGVVTINLPRIGFLAEDKADFFKRLGRLMRIAKDSLLVKRKTVEEFTEKGLYPYCKFYLEDVKKRTGNYWSNHFNTIGINGMNEAIENLLNKSIASEEGKAFAQEVMDFMRKRILQYQRSTRQLFNLEATPAEGTSYRFARIDKQKFPKIKVANEKDLGKDGIEPFYTNSTHLPVDYTDDIFEALDHQDGLQTRYNGGTVLHGFLGESLPDTKSVKKLIKKIASSYHLPYFTLTPTFSVCPKHGYLNGEHKYCPKCDREIGYKGG